MTTANLLATAATVFNASLHTAFVIVPAIKAAFNLQELAARVLTTSLEFIGLDFNPVKNDSTAKESTPKDSAPKDKASLYTRLLNFVPESIKHHNRVSADLRTLAVLHSLAIYTVTVMVSTFVLNRLFGPAPQILNVVARYMGSPLRMDFNYDVLQMVVNYVLPSK
jgi:hypothetical protein